MRNAIAFAADMLPVDQDARRALDETFADWDHEVRHARSVWARLGATTVGVAATVSVVSRATFADFRTPAFYRIAFGTLGMSVLFGMALAAPALWSQPLTAVQRLFLFPQAMTATLPLAAVCPAFISRRAGTSLLGLFLVLTLLAGATSGWIVPASNQRFRESFMAKINAARGQADNPNRISRGLAEMTGPELLALQNSTGSIRVARQINVRVVVVAMVPLALLLGVQARRYAAARRWRIPPVTASAGAALLAILGAHLVASAMTAVLLNEESVLYVRSATLWTFWTLPVVSLLGIASLARFASARERQNDVLVAP